MTRTGVAASADAGGHLAGWWVRAEPWPLLLAAVLLMLGYCWWYSIPWVAMTAANYYSDFCYGVVLFGAIAGARLLQVFVAREYAAELGLSFRDVRSRRRFWLWFEAVVALTFLAVRHEVPLSAGFAVSRRGFDALADEALADPASAHRLAGRWAGIYRVAGVEVIDRTVVFYVGTTDGPYGFARVPGARSDSVYNLPYQPEDRENHRAFPSDGRRAFFDPVGRRITGDWFVVYSSYWHSKVGWSRASHTRSGCWCRVFVGRVESSRPDGAATAVGSRRRASSTRPTRLALEGGLESSLSGN
jgi:hypothetical protein